MAERVVEHLTFAVPQRAVPERPAFTAKNRFEMPDSLLLTRGQGYAALAKYLPGHRDIAATPGPIPNAA